MVLPQAFRISIPPISNQYLNLVKNSSLGVAISYYEVTKVTQVSIAQSAPAVQAIALLMVIYLVISLLIAAVTNLVNRRLTLKGRTVRRAAPLPIRKLSPSEWVRANLFGSRLDTILTVVFSLLVLWAVYRIGRFVLVDARWEIVERNITNLVVGSFPRDQISRLWAALFVLAAALGFGAGAFGAQRRREVAEGRAVEIPGGGVRRLMPLFLLVAVLLWFSRSLEPVLLVLGVFAVGYVGNLLGQRTPRRLERFVPLVVLAGVLAAFLVIAAFGGVGWDRWGGFLLTVFLAVAAILLSFPFGVLLALGRRSSLPAVRAVCVGYIELFRGVPLIAILFMAFFMIGFFLPEGVDPPSLVTRAIIAFVLFTSAYVAEIVRGGLQSVPTGQIEAAQALGLSPFRTTRADRPAPGAAGRDPRARRAVHQPLQGHVARLHHRADGAAGRRAERDQAARLPRAGALR